MKIAVVFIVAALCGLQDAASVAQPNCLEQLFQDDAPVLLQSLATLLCNYKIAQGKVGCTVDNILGTHVTVTLQNAEQIADQVANVLFGYVDGIIAKVVKIVDEIPFLSDFVNAKNIVTDIQDVSCGVMEVVLTEVDKILKIISNVVANLEKRP